jgi:hypothetical protein
MKKEDLKKIRRLLMLGYLVHLNDASGDTFSKRYRVYQSSFTDELKVVLVNDDGEVVGLQG